MTTLASYYLYAKLCSPNVLHTGKVGQRFDDGMASRPLLRDFSKRATNGVFKNKTSQDDRTTHAFSELFHSAISTLTNGSNVQATLSLNGRKSQNSSAPRASNDAQYTSQTHAEIDYDAAKRQTSLETHKLICISFTGRLGNQLFQYASVLGLARQLRRVAVYEGGALLDSILKHPPRPTAHDGQYSDRCRKARVHWETSCCRFNPDFLRLDPRVDYTVGQYLQSWKYFEGFEKDVLNALQFSDRVWQSANESIGRHRKRFGGRTLVGVHVRRGDYLLKVHVGMGYRTAPAAYFRRAMNYMRRRFGSVAFLVSTDNARWFRRSVTSASDVIMLSRREAETDMALLTSLDHVIISVGTYSWWVGFLNRGVTVYWKDFIAPGTAIGNGFSLNGSTYVHPSWIPR